MQLPIVASTSKLVEIITVTLLSLQSLQLKHKSKSPVFIVPFTKHVNLHGGAMQVLVW